MLIYNATYQRETLSERPIRQPLIQICIGYVKMCCLVKLVLKIKEYSIKFLHRPKNGYKKFLLVYNLW